MHNAQVFRSFSRRGMKKKNFPRLWQLSLRWTIRIWK